jgi:hypothetical protein
MSDKNEIAQELADEILGGKENSKVMHLAALLEKSSLLRNSDDHYAQFLPPDLAEVTIPNGQAQAIISKFCSEIRCNPESRYLAAVSLTGSEEVTKVVADTLTSPPRELTTLEVSHALGILNSFLPSTLAHSRNFLSAQNLNKLMVILKELQQKDDITIKRDSKQLLTALEKLKKNHA